MMEETKARSKITTDIDGLSNDKKYNYIVTNSNTTTDNFLKSISIIIESPETFIKNKLESHFNKSLSLPGLMFNFTEVYSKNELIPRKYNYQQEFAYIIHESFNRPYVNIPKNDKEGMMDLILKFNEFYKAETFKETGRHTNAPLYCCTLISVLDLPMYSKYKDILTLIPIKDKNSYTSINVKWFKFINEKQNEQTYNPEKQNEEEEIIKYNSDINCIDLNSAI
jgi:hypothetical protein